VEDYTYPGLRSTSFACGPRLPLHRLSWRDVRCDEWRREGKRAPLSSGVCHFAHFRSISLAALHPCVKDHVIRNVLSRLIAAQLSDIASVGIGHCFQDLAFKDSHFPSISMALIACRTVAVLYQTQRFNRLFIFERPLWPTGKKRKTSCLESPRRTVILLKVIGTDSRNTTQACVKLLRRACVTPRE
jgi:hypothetical protein